MKAGGDAISCALHQRTGRCVGHRPYQNPPAGHRSDCPGPQRGALTPDSCLPVGLGPGKRHLFLHQLRQHQQREGRGPGQGSGLLGRPLDPRPDFRRLFPGQVLPYQPVFQPAQEGALLGPRQRPLPGEAWGPGTRHDHLLCVSWRFHALVSVQAPGRTGQLPFALVAAPGIRETTPGPKPGAVALPVERDPRRSPLVSRQRKMFGKPTLSTGGPAKVPPRFPCRRASRAAQARGGKSRFTPPDPQTSLRPCGRHV